MDAVDWDARYSEAGLLWSAQPNRFLVAEFGDVAPGSALDVACGEGRNAVWLATRGWEVTAVDHSEVGIDKGREMARAAGVGVEWVVADVTTYEPRREFDLVGVLYLHLPAPQMEAALANASAAVGGGGSLLVVGHHPDNIEHGFGGPQVAEILYGPDEIAAMLGDLQVEKAEQVARPVDQDGHEAIALDTLVRATKT